MRRMLAISSRCDPQPPLASLTPSFGAASRTTAIIASGTALIQSSRTGVSSSLLPA